MPCLLQHLDSTLAVCACVEETGVVLSSMNVFFPLPNWKLACASSIRVCRASIEGSSMSSSNRARRAYSEPVRTAAL